MVIRVPTTQQEGVSGKIATAIIRDVEMTTEKKFLLGSKGSCLATCKYKGGIIGACHWQQKNNVRRFCMRDVD